MRSRSAAGCGWPYKQQPGPDNPPGFVKLNFDNIHAVYLHDTPSPSPFGRNFRAASWGCVRVHGIEQLAAWVLADQGSKQEHITHMKETGERRDVRLKKPMPIYFTVRDGLGDAGRRRAIPPRPLPEGRRWRGRGGLLGRPADGQRI